MTQLALFLVACTSIGGSIILIGKWKGRLENQDTRLMGRR